MSQPLVHPNQTPLEWLIQKTSQTLPDLLALLGIAIGGWLIAVIFRRYTPKLVEKIGLDGLAERYGIARLLYAVGYKQSFAKLCGSIAYMICVVLTIQMLATKLGLSIISKLTTAFFIFLPNGLTATLMIFVGVKLGDLAKLRLQNKSEDQTSLWPMFGKVAKNVIIGLSTILALSQIGVRTELIIQITQVTTLAIAIAASIAIGMGARHTFKQIIASYYAKAMIKPGDIIILDHLRATLKSHNVTSCTVIDDEGNQHNLPSSWLLEQTYQILYIEDQIPA